MFDADEYRYDEDDSEEEIESAMYESAWETAMEYVNVYVRKID